MSPIASFVLALIAFICIAFGIFLMARKPAHAPSITTNRSNSNHTFSTGTSTDTPAITEVRTATFVSSVPVHNAVLSASPRNVTVAFSSVVGPASTMSAVNAQGAAVNLGRAKFSEDRLSMILDLASDLTSGISVSYSACAADNSQCGTGSFGFSIAP